MKFNEKTSGVDKRENFMGTEAYILKPRERLLQLASTCLLGEKKYYGSIKNQLNKTINEVAKKDPEYILQLASYVRNDLYLRTVSIALLVKASLIDECKPYVKKYTPAIIKRADELTEVVSALISEIGDLGSQGKKSIPAALKKGIALAFNNFDEYQFGKYKQSKSKVKLKDVVKLVHPKPLTAEQSALFKRIINDEIATPETWEVKLSAGGNKAAVWDELIENRKLPYMAMLRNLRNMLKTGISKWEEVISYLMNERAVINSKQLPHRFLSAYEAIDEPRKALFEKDEDFSVELKKAVNEAIEISAKNNIPKIDGKTIIICDNSGSARGDAGGDSNLSSKTVRTMSDVGNLLGLLTWYASDNTMFGVFGDRLDLLKLDRTKGILNNFKLVNNAGENVGQATEQGVFTMLQTMIKDKIITDRLIVCSDLQIGDGTDHEYGIGGNYNKSVPQLLKEYREKVNPKMVYYSVCFGGYGDNVVDSNNNNVLISGWNDKILQFIKNYEGNKETQVKHVKKITPDSFNRKKQ